jgi:hypothetical protein
MLVAASTIDSIVEAAFAVVIIMIVLARPIA